MGELRQTGNEMVLPFNSECGFHGAFVGRTGESTMECDRFHAVSSSGGVIGLPAVDCRNGWSHTAFIDGRRGRSTTTHVCEGG